MIVPSFAVKVPSAPAIGDEGTPRLKPSLSTPLVFPVFRPFQISIFCARVVGGARPGKMRAELGVFRWGAHSWSF